MLPARPRLRTDIVIRVFDAKSVILLGDDEHRLLHGRIYAHLLPLLDGTRGPAELITALGNQITAPEVYYALGKLASFNTLVDGPRPAGIETSEEAWWNRMGLDGGRAEARLAARPVHLVAIGAVTVSPFEAAFTAAGVQLDTGPQAFRVVLTDDYLHPEIEPIAQEMRAAEKPWLLAMPLGIRLQIGPLFCLSSPCWSCLAQRLRGHRLVEGWLQRRQGANSQRYPSRVRSPGHSLLAPAVLATQIIRILVTDEGADPTELRDGLVTLDLRTRASVRHRLVARPQCRICGTLSVSSTPREAVPIVLEPAPKVPGSGHRTALAQQTWNRFEHHVSPITGIVASIDETWYDRDINMFSMTAVHDFPSLYDKLSTLRTTLRGRSGGKGSSRLQARVGALAEAIERYSGIWRGEEEAAFVASPRELGDDAISLDECMSFSPTQRRERDAWNRNIRDPHQAVPVALELDDKISWTPAWSLTHERSFYLPTAYCYYGHSDMKRFFCIADSNGCAAGNTLEEAILEGLLELLERDAVAIWWYNRIQRAAVDTSNMKLPWVDNLRSYFESVHRDLSLLDISSELGVPTVAAVSRRTDGPVEDILLGFGAHLDRQAAVLRAVAELSQSYPSVSGRTAAGETQYITQNDEMRTWYQTATVASEPYLLPAPPANAVDTVLPVHDDVTEDLKTLVEALRQAGLNVLIVDQTRPDIGMNVARVVVPGLCHFWRRLGYRRLYEVPVRQGLLEQPVPEDRLNPFSIFF